MNTERGIIFWNYQILNLFLFAVCSALFFAFGLGKLIFTLAVIVGFIVFVLFSPLRIVVSPNGISSNSILLGWSFKWENIRVWHIVLTDKNKYTIWFEANGQTYKISKTVFREHNIDKLKAYFERYCDNASGEVKFVDDIVQRLFP
ncbi:MAG TPA: hypothetical protein PKY59_16975 [Pyrinomonadaceae bacterium]|nr:hypothetical protein [Pyrinomonadaceae bacterium]